MKELKYFFNWGSFFLINFTFGKFFAIHANNYCLGWKTFECRVFRRYIFWFKLLFWTLFVCLFVFFYLRFNFFYIHMLPLKYSCQKCSFSSGKKWLFSEKLFLFLDRWVNSKIKQCYCQIFPYVLIILKPTRSIK